MESGNSGSMAQSSSDGDEEYDSPHCGAGAESSHQHPYPRDAHVFPFSTHVTAPPPPPPPFFDPLAAYSTLLNPDVGAWCTRSDPNPLTGPAAGNTTQPPPPGKNPRKRTRASRRAPTTVLTTDTNNFRAMVQEFTGIPASPFAAAASSSSAARARLDQLFGSNRNFLPELPPQHHRPPYLQRFTNNHQIQLPTTAPALTTAATTTSTPGVINYQLPLSDLGLISNIPANNNLPVMIGNNHQLLSSGPLSWVEEGLGSSARSAINGGNCNVNSTAAVRCEGMLESWICSTDH